MITLLFFGAFHLRLYVRKRQGTAFKFNGKWPATDSPAFLLPAPQTANNMVWTLTSAVPFWTAYEARDALGLLANGYVPLGQTTPRTPCIAWPQCCWCRCGGTCISYLVRRLLRWPPLYHAVHKLHHNNVNPGP